MPATAENHRAPPIRGWRPGRVVLGVGGIVALLTLVVLSLPLWLPTGPIKGAFAEAVKAGLGRDLVIRGTLHAGLFPVRLEASDAALVQQENGPAPPLVTARKLTAVLSLSRLVRGIVTITDLRLEEPVFLLSVDEQGRPNWTERPGSGQPAGPAPTDEVKRQTADTEGFSLYDIRIADGTFRIEDARSRSAFQADALTLKASLPALDRPLTASGTFSWRGRPVQIAASLANPRQLGGGGTSAGHVEFTAAAGRLLFDGTIAGMGSAVASGDLELDVPSIEQFAAWTGHTLAFSGPGTLALAGKATFSQEKLALTDATVSLDRIKATGALTSALGGDRPRLDGTLSFAALDLTPYMSSAPVPASESGWSTEPIAPETLPPLDLRLALAAATVTLPQLTLGRSAAVLTVDGNRLALDRLALPYDGGELGGRISVTEGGSAPKWQAALMLRRLRLDKLIAATGGVSRVTGLGSADLRVTAEGRSPREIAGSLAGTARVATVDTEIKGVHLPSLVGNVPGAIIAAASGRDVPPNRARIEASFRIAGGVARTDDLDIASQAIRLTGEGAVDIGRRRVNLLLTPRIISPSAVSLVGVRLSGFAAPILVEGPWNAPRYLPQTDKAVAQHLGDPAQALKDALPGKAPAGKDSGFDPIGWLDRLFGGDSAK